MTKEFSLLLVLFLLCLVGPTMASWKNGVWSNGWGRLNSSCMETFTRDGAYKLGNVDTDLIWTICKGTSCVKFEDKPLPEASKAAGMVVDATTNENNSNDQKMQMERVGRKKVQFSLANLGNLRVGSSVAGSQEKVIYVDKTQPATIFTYEVLSEDPTCVVTLQVLGKDEYVRAVQPEEATGWSAGGLNFPLVVTTMKPSDDSFRFTVTPLFSTHTHTPLNNKNK